METNYALALGALGWFIVALLIYYILVRIFDLEYEEEIFPALIAAGLWPVIGTVGLFLAPLVGVHKLARWQNKRRITPDDRTERTGGPTGIYLRGPYGRRS